MSQRCIYCYGRKHELLGEPVISVMEKFAVVKEMFIPSRRYRPLTPMPPGAIDDVSSRRMRERWGDGYGS
jgi:hypothetical protein